LSEKSSNEKRRALGRGLAALLPSSGVPVGDPADTSTGPFRLVPLTSVKPNPEQPRKVFSGDELGELASSIRERGIVQPLVLRRLGGGSGRAIKSPEYQIVAGERRWRAAGLAGLSEVPAIVREYDDLAALEVALIENIQRQDLDPLEEAHAFSVLIDEHGQTQEQIARAVGKSRSAVANSLRLLRLPDGVMPFVADGSLTAGHARALMTIGDESSMVALASEIKSRGLSVRDSERRARRLARDKSAQSRDDNSEDLRPRSEIEVERRLARSLGTRVGLKMGKAGGGRIEIDFHSLDQLDDLLSRFSA